MSNEAPFKVGQRVRMTAHGRELYRARNPHSYRGIVTRVVSVLNCDNEWNVCVHRDGIKRPDGEWWSGYWEAIPFDDLSLDDVCQQLVAAYHAGDKTAALGLAERVFELLGGTKRENQV